MGFHHTYLDRKKQVVSMKILVAAAVIVDDLTRPTKMLAARRSQPAAIAGRWEFPGGKVEPNENDRDGLRRELREELGVEVELGAQILGPVNGDWPITDRHLMRLWFVILTAGTPTPLVEHDQLRWITPDQFGDFDWLDGDLPIVDHLVSLFEAS